MAASRAPQSEVAAAPVSLKEAERDVMERRDGETR